MVKRLPEATHSCPDRFRGTRRGAIWHREKWRERPCDPCMDAEREYMNSYRPRASQPDYRGRQRRNVSMPVEMFAELYLNAPLSLATKLEERFGQDRIDEWVRRFDEENAA